MKLRKLNAQGLQTFQEFIREAREGGSSVRSAPKLLLTWPVTSEEISGAPELRHFEHPTSRFELARYLHEQFEDLDRAVIEGKEGSGDRGFWAALSLFYFDILSPGYQQNGHRILADNCYIPEIDTAMAGVRYFRHRIAGAYRLYGLHREMSQPLLLANAGVQSELYAGITDSVFYTETRCVVEAINLLYFDRGNQCLKLGWNSKDKPGAFSRLLAVIDQFDLTYDLQGIDGGKLLGQLPGEFNAWKPLVALTDDGERSVS